MSIRKLVSVVPVVAVLALAAPVATASAQATGPSSIPCYPYPAFCGPNGQPWFSFTWPYQIPTPALYPPTTHFGPGPVQLPPVL